MTFPGSARLEATLYFKSRSLGELIFVEVDLTPSENGELEMLAEGIAELSRRWCAALNRMRKVNDFRPATLEEVPSCVPQHGGLDQRHAPARPIQPLARPTSAPRASSANRVRYRFGELSRRYLGMSQRAFDALRSRRRSRWPT